jgi:four helix bundle protein
MESSSLKTRDLEERLFAFSLRIIRLCQTLQEKPGVARTLSYQLPKSGTSIGANYQEAQAGQSKADFVSKNGIVLKEARETCYWLRLLGASQLVPMRLLDDLMKEAHEISRIFGSIVSRSKKAMT